MCNAGVFEVCQDSGDLCNQHTSSSGTRKCFCNSPTDCEWNLDLTGSGFRENTAARCDDESPPIDNDCSLGNSCVPGFEDTTCTANGLCCVQNSQSGCTTDFDCCDYYLTSSSITRYEDGDYCNLGTCTESNSCTEPPLSYPAECCQTGTSCYNPGCVSGSAACCTSTQGTQNNPSAAELGITTY